MRTAECRPYSAKETEIGMNIILGSKSPRRSELLTKLGVAFEVLAADVDESTAPELSAGEAVAQISARKAAVTARLAGPDDLIVCADTVVVLDDRVMGKPKTPAEAREMLTALSGRTHEVLTGLTVRRGEQAVTVVECTRVTFRALLPREIETYIASGEPMDKAGSYGIQGLAASFVSHLDGDYFNVMGLPLCALTGILRRFGVRVLGA